MEMVSTCIRGGSVWYKGRFARLNINIINGKIARIGKENMRADIEIDARGKYVLPGLIDVHVHCREPGYTYKEDFKTASYAAAQGGITTMMDMPNTQPPTTTIDRLEKKSEMAKKSIVNTFFHFGATNDNLDEIKNTCGQINSLKIYLCESTGGLRMDKKNLPELFNVCKEKNITIVVHAEDDTLVRYFEGAAEKKGLPYSVSRPGICASKALIDTLSAAKRIGCKIHIAHISTRGEMNIIRTARENNIKVSCEVTPHHLFLTERDEKELGDLVKTNPPLRGEKDRKTLWLGLSIGAIDCIATDHAPHTLEEKIGKNPPKGVPGLETSLPLMLDASNRGLIPLGLIPRVMAEKPAEIFNLKNKGFLLQGADADITIVDIGINRIIEGKKFYTKSKWTPFEGWKIKGAPVCTIVGGNIVMNDGKIMEQHH